MRRVLLLITAAWVAMGSVGHAQEAETKLVTVVTAAEPQTQLMAMVLTFQAQQQGAAVRMLLCGPAGDLALREPPATATAPQEPRGMSPQGLMSRIMDGGATVEVCAIYLPNKGLGADALLDGIAAAEPGAMAAALMATETRVLSF
jgi:intracellular sulfur oxidation DsrE/DsrF family protein